SLVFFHTLLHLFVLLSFPTRRSSDLVFGVHWLAPSMVVFVSFFLFLEILHRRIHLGQWVPWGAAHHHKHHEAPTARDGFGGVESDRKSTRLNSSHVAISYAVFCLKKK